jgi:hypothetical protein
MPRANIQPDSYSVLESIDVRFSPSGPRGFERPTEECLSQLRTLGMAYAVNLHDPRFPQFRMFEELSIMAIAKPIMFKNFEKVLNIIIVT